MLKIIISKIKHKFCSIKIIDTAKDRLWKKRSKAEKQYKLKIFLVKYLPIIPICIISSNTIVSIIVSGLWWLLVTIFYDHKDIVMFRSTIRVWFGVPGSGKTSMAAWLCDKSISNFHTVLSNVQIDGAYKLEESDLGKYDMSFGGMGCHVLYDEATLEGLDNRQHKEFANSNKPRYFSIHRHMLNRVDIFSQGYDVDKRVRDRTEDSGLFHLIRLGIPGFVMYRRINKIFFIEKEKKQIIDGFKYRGLPRICFTMPVWDSFDTLDDSLCPKLEKEWEKW